MSLVVECVCRVCVSVCRVCVCLSVCVCVCVNPTAWDPFLTWSE